MSGFDQCLEGFHSAHVSLQWHNGLCQCQPALHGEYCLHGQSMYPTRNARQRRRLYGNRGISRHLTRLHGIGWICGVCPSHHWPRYRCAGIWRCSSLQEFPLKRLWNF